MNVSAVKENERLRALTLREGPPNLSAEGEGPVGMLPMDSFLAACGSLTSFSSPPEYFAEKLSFSPKDLRE